MTTSDQSDNFPLDEARELVKDLLTPNPAIYWFDFLISVTIGWAAFVATLGLPAFSIEQSAAFLISGFALYRAVLFTHELTHLKRGTFGLFRLVWNLICGFPLMVPSFTYHGVHNDHHKRDIYGTTRDGEYVPFATNKPYKIVTYVLLASILPLFFATRFLLLTPLGWLSGNLRQLIWQRASSLTIDLTYHRPGLARRDDRTWRWQELGAFLYGWTALLLVVFGVVPTKMLLLWYLVAFLIFTLNSFRTLAAHAYRNPGDRFMTVPEQFLDSVNVPGNNFLTPLWAPVGLRYHATHHLFPGIPYHSLGLAHHRLVVKLSDNRLYLQATRMSLWHALRTLWRDAASNPARVSAPTRR